MAPNAASTADQSSVGTISMTGRQNVSNPCFSSSVQNSFACDNGRVTRIFLPDAVKNFFPAVGVEFFCETFAERFGAFLGAAHVSAHKRLAVKACDDGVYFKVGFRKRLRVRVRADGNLAAAFQRSEQLPLGARAC